MRVTIIKKPIGTIEDMWVPRLDVGQTYNLNPGIAERLVLQGYALWENRWGERRKTPRPAALGRLGGQRGGPARAAALSPKRRRQIARKAALERWKGH